MLTLFECLIVKILSHWKKKTSLPDGLQGNPNLLLTSSSRSDQRKISLPHSLLVGESEP